MFKTVEHDGIDDQVAIEEPLEIRIDGDPLAVTMRTPGHDEELALGFLYGEGLIDGPREAGPTADFAANIVEVSGPLTRDPAARNFYTSSSCGVCGKGALEEVAVTSAPLPPGPVIARSVAADLPSRLEQPGFIRTGGLHATGLFDAEGSLVYTREDVGRHNAMDKVVGRALLDGLRAAGRVTPRCASAGGCPSSWCRRRRWPERRSWSGWAPQAHWPSIWPPTEA